MDNLTDDKAREKVWEMIRHIKFAQLVTHVGADELAARPMMAMNRDFDGNLWFFTRADSPKIDEIARNPHVLLSYSEPDDQQYISIQGKAETVNDRAKIAQLWSEATRAWFPKGKEDPDLRLIRVQMTRAEYWDSPSSVLVMIYGYAVARLTGEALKVGENRKVSFA